MTASKPKRKAEPHTVTVNIVQSDYQPSKAQLEADARVNATFDEAVQALTKPVKIKYVDRPTRGK